MSKMSYEEYVKYKLERARQQDYFDEDGNSTTGVTNRSFLRELKLDLKPLTLEVFSLITYEHIKDFLLVLLSVVFILLLPVTYLPTLIARAVFRRKRAKKEMMYYYNRYLEKETNNDQ